MQNTCLDFNVEQSAFTKDHIREIEKFNKFEKEKAEQHFDEVATYYEQIYTRVGYLDPVKCSEQAVRVIEKEMLRPEQVKVCDFACGTGLVGKYLAQKGFNKITGLDLSQRMLDEAEQKGVYSDLVKYKLGQNDYLDNFPMNLRQQFDIVTCAGLVNNNYLDITLFESMLVALKKDGYLIFSARYSYLGDYWYIDQLAELEKMGRIKAVYQEAFFKYDQLMGGIGKFTKTPVKVYVYKKTEGDSVMVQHQINKKLSSMTASTDYSDMFA